MTTVTINDELAARLRALRDKGEDFSQVIETALTETARRWEREAAARAEASAILNGPRHSWADAAFRRKHSIPDGLHLSIEELEREGDAILASLPPEKIAEAERLGLLYC